MSPTSERLTQLRLLLVALSLGFWGLIIAFRLVQVQIVSHAAYEKRAARQSQRTIKLAPRRGLILDRNGHQLAVSVDAESIYADPQTVGDAPAVAHALAQALRFSPSDTRDLDALLRRDRAFVWVKRKVHPDQANAVRSLDLPGVGLLTENRRYYPKRELAAQVIGFAGLDNDGMWGIEYALDDTIRGREAKVVVRTDGLRRPVGHIEKPSTDGHTVVLTLDETIQHAAERELDSAVRATQAIGGIAIVVDPRTGEILALANRPTFNPNSYGSFSNQRWRDRAVTDYYEPGSIFKIIVAAAALQEGVVSPDEIIDCGMGSVEVGGIRINDHAVFDHLAFRDVIAKSSDIGMIRVAQRLGRDNFNRYMRDFGFGSLTGVGLPGESPGRLRPMSEWSALSLASMSFGQEIGVTGIQMVMAAAAIANGGYLMKPLIVREIDDPSGKVVKRFRPEAVRRVVDPAIADTVVNLMKGVVRQGGTGRRAAVAGYAVAGKTGTAQKVDATGHYSTTDNVASFVGLVPASRPELVILVSLDTPRGAHTEGGDVAAPVFAKVAEESLRRLAVLPDDPSRRLRASAAPAGIHPASYTAATRRSDPTVGLAPGEMPDLRGRSAREAAAVAARLGLGVELHGSGEVQQQVPPPGSQLSAERVLQLWLGHPQPAPSAPEPLFQEGT